MDNPNTSGNKIPKCKGIGKVVFDEIHNSSVSFKFSFLNWKINPKTEKNAVIIVNSNDAETEICGWNTKYFEACKNKISRTPIPEKEIRLRTELTRNTIP